MISIIIPTYNREALLKKCLEQVFNSSYKHYEVIVVDDCSTDNTSKLIKKFKCERISLKENKGVGNARNIGAQHAKGSILFFIDSDVIIKKDTLKNIIKNFNEHPRLKLMCGYKLPQNLSNDYSSDFVMLRKTYETSRWLKSSEVMITNSFIETAAFAIKKETFNGLGGFSTEFKKSGVEDHELGHRINQHYGIYFFKNLGVLHHFEPIGSYLRKVFRRTYCWGELFFRTGKFETKSIATKTEAINALVSLLCFVSLFGVLFYARLLALTLVFFSVLLIRRKDFYLYVLKRKNVLFTIIMAFFDYLIYFANGLAGAVALIKKSFETILLFIKESYYLSKAFTSKTPANIGFFVTSKCNLLCKHCFYWKQIKESKNKNELTLKEIQNISKNLDVVYYLTITGGEPSLRNDLPEICETFYKNNNLRMISFHTNGMMPERISKQTEQILKKCPQIKINIGIGVDGLEQTHNLIRGNNKSFKNVLKTISCLKKLQMRYPNLDIQCCSTFSSYSKKRLLEAVNYFQDTLGIQFGQTLIRGDPYSKQAKDVSLEEFRAFLKGRIPDNNRRWKMFKTLQFTILRQIIGYSVPIMVIKTLTTKTQAIPCKAGIKTLVINETGEVFPCEMLNEKLGSLRDSNYDIKKILAKETSKEILKKIKNKSCYCTHEGNMYVNLVFDYKHYPNHLLAVLKGVR